MNREHIFMQLSTALIYTLQWSVKSDRRERLYTVKIGFSGGEMPFLARDVIYTSRKCIGAL